ncbi:MAG: aspartate/tyrosine/aromatic aminotransferase [Gammaproteobacteria bacterium]|jgi:aspartate aminotransferase|nr:aspartate/tyrosine/aromatic aminotransferase [Gammaproteobacteria bacterium]MBP6051107.1 aspartate/tyrosine/aromatic aminotransferase [Pseudomonadales bacterium]MBK6584211.1 aspartate/tyrosine/aromatic aminotransferase [Gammaproteobacteria bacterium]MBK7520395.1 aspartate/tyrosine/aromatic aminotransferase [Gammaproteobacteria bacterium]MBK7728117.1 aspartate/tyrosine/aromatic aminotransferase [Gammaproteobacteria bacterium]
MFENLCLLAPDPILGLMAEFRQDPRTRKIDLGVGVYQDESGCTPIMRAVHEAEAQLLRTETTKTYQGIAGDPLYNERMSALLLGQAHPVLVENRCRGVQTPGGCGALRIGAELIRRARPDARVWVSTPTWANHIPLIGGAGLQILEYPYYDAARRAIDFDAMMSTLAGVGAGDIVLLHGCCHNPTGADLDLDQWRAIAGLALKNGFTPFVDTAYQGLGDGIDQDAEGLRLLSAVVPECIVAASCSKNFGLYRERAGAVFFIAANPAAADAVASQAMASARQIYSMPPAHGAAIVATILGDDGLRSRWQAELGEVRDRINAMRVLLAERLADNAAGIDFSFIPRQKGMFSFLGISSAQLERLREEFGVYMVGSTRVNLAGINHGNIDHLAAALHAVLGARG